MFTDKALGITTGYNFWYLLSITAPAEIVAASSLITYWNTSINLAVWISIFMVVILVFNLLPVRFYGEVGPSTSTSCCRMIAVAFGNLAADC